MTLLPGKGCSLPVSAAIGRHFTSVLAVLRSTGRGQNRERTESERRFGTVPVAGDFVSGSLAD